MQNINTDENGVALDSDEEIAKKTFYNSILLNKYPYFFKYRYKDCKKSYNVYVDENEVTCHQRFRMTLKKLLLLDRHDKEQKEFIEKYYKHMPVTVSDSSMNLLCKYIESINFNISQKTKSIENDILVNVLKNKDYSYSDDLYCRIINNFKEHIKNIKFNKQLAEEIGDGNNLGKFDLETIKEYRIDNNSLKDVLSLVCYNPYIVVNCLIDYHYAENPKSNKDILWSTYGKYIFNNIRENTKAKIYFPFPHEDGEIEYMGKKYKLKEIKF